MNFFLTLILTIGLLFTPLPQDDDGTDIPDNIAAGTAIYLPIAQDMPTIRFYFDINGNNTAEIYEFWFASAFTKIRIYKDNQMYETQLDTWGWVRQNPYDCKNGCEIQGNYISPLIVGNVCYLSLRYTIRDAKYLIPMERKNRQATNNCEF